MIRLSKEQEMPPERLIAVFEKLGLKERMEKANSIVIKPNFASGSSVAANSHVVSDIDLIAEIVHAVMRISSARVFLAESDSMGYGYAFLKFENLGLPQALALLEEEAKRFALLDLSRDRLTRVQNTAFRYFTTEERQLWLSETLLSADCILSLSNLKTHSVTGYTGACKNLFGCLPEMKKYCYHPAIHKVVHDLVIALRPCLNVIDAFYGMEKNGPVFGVPVSGGFRIFSDDAVEADMAASASAGFQPGKIGYLRLLQKTRGTKSTARLPAECCRHYEKPDFFLRVFNRFGLGIQRAGAAVEFFGHRIHTCSGLFEFFIALLRPILVRLFPIEKLKAIKRRIVKNV